MSRKIEEVLLRPGDSVSFADRDDLLKKLDDLSRRVPGRLEGRTKDHREHFCMLRYLRFLTGEGLLPLPITLRKTPEHDDPPDFTLEWPEEGRTETFELTDGSTEEYQKALTETERTGQKTTVFPMGVDIDTPDAEAAERWAEILFSAFVRKGRGLAEGRSRAALDDEDEPLMDALARLVAVIGEAAHHVSVETRSELDEIRWPDVVNMRHRLIHAYYDVDLDILWATVQRSLPELIGHLEAHLAEPEGAGSDER
jgi:uncharacterized protein with HEPN domain